MNKVLLVDDDVELAAMLQGVHRERGFRWRFATMAKAGVAAALSGQYAIVVPRRDDAAPQRHRGPAPHPCPQPGAGADVDRPGDDVDRIVGLELGADDYVPKPHTRASWWPGCGRSCAAAASPPALRPPTAR